MLKKIIEKNKKQKYLFSETGIAGTCPDCGHIVEYRSYFQEYNCTAQNCAFVANKDGERVWDNKKRDENLKKLQEESDYRIKNGLDLY